MSISQCSSPVNVNVNGEAVRLTSPATLAGLLALRNPRPPFAVEVNRIHIRRPQYDSIALSEGDQVEIVTLVGGG